MEPRMVFINCKLMIFIDFYKNKIKVNKVDLCKYYGIISETMFNVIKYLACHGIINLHIINM